VLLLAIALAAVFRPSVGLVTFVIAAVLWTSPARIEFGCGSRSNSIIRFGPIRSAVSEFSIIRKGGPRSGDVSQPGPVIVARTITRSRSDAGATSPIHRAQDPTGSLRGTIYVTASLDCDAPTVMPYNPCSRDH
jgi:hypothetical protein